MSKALFQLSGFRSSWTLLTFQNPGWILDTLDTFGDSDCWEMFRFRKSDFHRLLRAFHLDGLEDFVIENGMRFAGIEILITSLHRHACVDSLSHFTVKFLVLTTVPCALSRVSQAIFEKCLLRAITLIAPKL